MSQSKDGKVTDKERCAEITCEVAKEMNADMYHSNIEKFFRGFEEVPPDYVQTVSDNGVPTAKAGILMTDDPKKIQLERYHVMVVGSACTGKSTLINRIVTECTSGKIHILPRKDLLIFIVSMRMHSGDERLTLREFLFRDMVLDISEEGKESGYQWMLKTSQNVIFMMDALHTVPYRFELSEHERLNMDLEQIESPPVFVHNILAGNLFPKAKIISCCRTYMAGNLKGKLRPHKVVEVGELTIKSMKTVMKGYLGPHFSGVYRFWMEKLPRIFVLNKTLGFLRYNLMSCGMGTYHRISGSVPTILLNLILSCTYQRHVVIRRDTRPLILPMIQKMKKMAYCGMIEFKYVFDETEANERFDICEEENQYACISYPGKQDYRCQILVMKPDKRYYFIDNCIQEFLCALVVAEMKIDDFNVFIGKYIHTQRFSIVRRMVCALVFDSNVHDIAVKEKLFVEPEDYQLQRKALQASMMEEFHRLKRRDLLEFFHAVHDCSDKRLGIVPKNIEVLDFSHIRLFVRDMQAIGASLSGGIKVQYLNLSNCEITSEGMNVFTDKLIYADTVIKRFNLDWNKDWQYYVLGTEACADAVKHCSVQELSLNHNKLTASALQTFGRRLDRSKLKTVYLRDNETLGAQGFNILGDFLMRHKVQYLHLSHEDIAAPYRMRMFKAGPKKFVIETGMIVDDRAVLVGRLDSGDSD